MGVIDFTNAVCFKLIQVDNSAYADKLAPMLVDGEKIVSSFQTVRDGIVFTDRRIIAITLQGVTGKKVDYTTLPYQRIQTFSVETAGILDLDSELDLWFAGMGHVRFEFAARCDVAKICKSISEKIL